MSHQPPATSHQPPGESHQPPATSHQPMGESHQPPATSHQPPETSILHSAFSIQHNVDSEEHEEQESGADEDPRQWASDKGTVTQKCRLAVLVSGGGTTLQAIIDAIEAGECPAEIALVVSSRREVKAPDRARKHGIPVEIIRPRDFSTREEYDQAVADSLLRAKPDLIVLAGYLSTLSPQVVEAFPGRIMNIHPSLLPAFGGKGCYGRYVHEKVLQYGCKVSGVTVMLVDQELDTGPIVLQEAVVVAEDETVESLTTKVGEVERKLYPRAISLFAQGRLQLQERRVNILPGRDK